MGRRWAPPLSTTAGTRRTAAVVTALILLLPAVPEAHEIPADVTVHAFVKVEPDRLRVLMRVPLVSLGDYEFPTWGEGYLDLPASGPVLRTAVAQRIGDHLRVWEGGRARPGIELVRVRGSIPGDRAFTSYETALAGLSAPEDATRPALPWQQAVVDILFEVPISDPTADFSIEPQVAHLGLRTATVLRFLPMGGSERAYQYEGDPGVIRLDPRWHHAAWSFGVLGFRHILEGFDHLLFLLCLVIPLRSVRSLVPVVTAFTLAHSITLVAAALGFAPDALWFPPLIEALIALSIVVMAFENILGTGTERRWLMAFGFGLVHGFGFSFLLSESMQFAGGHLIASLLSFNIGVEVGQLVALIVMVPVLDQLLRRVPGPVGVILLSALVAHTGWHWMTGRALALFQYDLAPPAFDLAFWAAASRWLALAVIAAGVAWGLGLLFGTLRPAVPEGSGQGAGEP